MYKFLSHFNVHFHLYFLFSVCLFRCARIVVKSHNNKSTKQNKKKDKRETNTICSEFLCEFWMVFICCFLSLSFCVRLMLFVSFLLSSPFLDFPFSPYFACSNKCVSVKSRFVYHILTWKQCWRVRYPWRCNCLLVAHLSLVFLFTLILVYKYVQFIQPTQRVPTIWHIILSLYVWSHLCIRHISFMYFCRFFCQFQHKKMF